MPSNGRAIDLYVACGQRRGRDPLHWIILAVPRGENRCTYYHVVGGPTQGKAYRLEIQANKRVDSSGIASKEYVSSINESDINKLKSAAQKIPVQQCQVWVTGVLGELEKKGMVPAGKAAYFHARIERTPSPPAQSGSRSSSQARATQPTQPGSRSSSQARNTQPGSRSSSQAHSIHSGTTGGATGVQWVWDQQYNRYRYYDGHQWIFQQ